MKKVFVFTFIFIFTLSAKAQDSLARKNKIEYGGMQQLGIMAGETGLRSVFCITNGLRYKNMFIGIGADAAINRSYYYNDRQNNNSAFFIDTRYYINKRKNFFAKANGGVNIITKKSYTSYGNTYKNMPGGYAAFGLGFKARLGKEVFYSFDINYCIRQTRYNQTYKDSWSNQWQTDRYDIRKFVILINMGLEIF